MRVIRREAYRRIAILTAEKSMKTKFIGTCARALGAVPVARAQDYLKSGKGKIYLPDPINNPSLVRGIDTDFETDAEVGGLVSLPVVNSSAASADILEIHSATELKIKKEFKGPDAVKQLTGREDVNDEGKIMNGGGGEESAPAKGFEGCTFKTAPKIDQTKVYDAVFHRLSEGECVCIFPEGGSHDRTELLPLKGMSDLRSLLSR